MVTARKRVLFLIGLFVLLLAPILLADGGLFIKRPYDDSIWELQDMKNQVCAINYEDGMEKMLLSIEPESFDSKSAVWIFPVPTKPEDVLIDTFDEFPSISGNDLGSEARSKFSGSLFVMSMTQIYPITLALPLAFVGSTMSAFNLDSLQKASSGGSVEGVTVHEHLEKLGLITELITAEDKDSFYMYLISKNLTVPEKFGTVAESYLEKDYSFVVSWVSDSTSNIEGTSGYIPDLCYSHSDCSQACSGICPLNIYGCCVNGDIGQCNSNTHTCYCSRDPGFCQGCLSCDYDNQYCNGYSKNCVPRQTSTPYGYVRQGYYGKRLSVFVSFPTREIFFPMKLTSTYESKQIPMTIYVLSYVAPKTYSKIAPYTKTSYLVSLYVPYSQGLSGFFGNEAYGSSGVGYTKIEINAPSKYLVDDLWIQPQAPARVIIADSVYKHTFWWAIIIFVLASCLASLFAGFIVFRNNKPSYRNFALFGLFNFLTLLGVAAASFILKIDTRFTKLKQNTSKKVSAGEIMFKAFLVSVALSILPLLIILSIMVPSLMYYNVFGLFYLILLWPVLTTIILFFMLPIVWGYYRNKNLLKFIILFSVSFLAMLAVFWMVSQFVF